MSLEFSALGAMSALYAQIEDRLNQTEDYRALKALELAIASVKQQNPAARLASALQATPAALILPNARFAPVQVAAVAGHAPAATPSPSPAETPSGLMQRLAANFPGASVQAPAAMANTAH